MNELSLEGGTGCGEARRKADEDEDEDEGQSLNNSPVMMQCPKSQICRQQRPVLACAA